MAHHSIRNRTLTLSVEFGSLTAVLDYVREELAAWRLSEQHIRECVLVSEELFVKILDAAPGAELRLTTVRRAGGLELRFSFDGSFFPLPVEGDPDPGSKILLRYSDQLQSEYRRGTNQVSLAVRASYSRFTTLSLILLGCGLALGAILYYIPALSGFSAWLCSGLLDPILELYVKALGTIAGPTAFFLLAYNLSSMTKKTDRQPVIRSFFLRSLLTSLAAIVLGVALCGLSWPLWSKISLGVGAGGATGEGTVFSSFWEIILCAIPDNILSPFTESFSLPLLCLAIVTGISVPTVGRYADTLHNALDALHALFSRMLAVIFSFAPWLLGLESLVLTTRSGLRPLLFYLLITILLIVGSALLSAVFSLSLMLRGFRPGALLRQMSTTLVTIFRIGSSVEAVPCTVRSCRRLLRLPVDYLDAVIPLGATVNMDGMCLSLTILALTLAQACGQPPDLSSVAILLPMILILSMGAPTEPGGILIGMLVLLPQLGLSSELMLLALPIEILSGNFMTVLDVAGDIILSVCCAYDTKLIPNASGRFRGKRRDSDAV